MCPPPPSPRSPAAIMTPMTMSMASHLGSPLRSSQNRDGALMMAMNDRQQERHDDRFGRPHPGHDHHERRRGQQHRSPPSDLPVTSLMSVPQALRSVSRQCIPHRPTAHGTGARPGRGRSHRNMGPRSVSIVHRYGARRWIPAFAGVTTLAQESSLPRRRESIVHTHNIDITARSTRSPITDAVHGRPTRSPVAPRLHRSERGGAERDGGPFPPATSPRRLRTPCADADAVGSRPGPVRAEFGSGSGRIRRPRCR